MNKILILGGTGFVGSHLCEKLTRLAWRSTVPTRRLAGAKHLWMLPLLDLFEADVHDEAALTRLVAGHDAVVNLVGLLHGNEAAFDKMHVQLPQKLARACAATGVRRVVHVSALGAGNDAPSMYQRSKARGEEVLRAADLDLTVLRPSVIFGPEDKFLNLFARLQRVFPVLPLAGSAAKFQPVWVEDVAAAVVTSLQERRRIGETYEACGPQVLTLKELVQLAGRYSGRERPIIPLPMALGRLQALLMEMAPGEPLISRDNLDAMKVDNIASGLLPGLQALGITPSALSTIAPSYLHTQGQEDELLAMRRTAGRF
ncbi:complex I NDUFA9 subunit family protein [Rhodoferax sediminis]|jgi:NADH dehydrogenase|uniref:Complex I NDUFA9 subunit family protein n=1 Tax=Rhodoferax sediminis TaxID=2509614 RepID=A0A515D7B6_9BURK|nr:complex I NDUFA9 subunit family protein [Rhodoferax sediminis]QDL36296.1 complex I NDUFA9 subunit family protein [Rhodoferax sediminis]